MKKKELTYEEAMQQVEMLMEKIENNRIGMNELSETIKKASEYLTYCKEKLRQVDEEVEQILKETAQ